MPSAAGVNCTALYVAGACLGDIKPSAGTERQPAGTLEAIHYYCEGSGGNRWPSRIGWTRNKNISSRECGLTPALVFGP